MGHSLGNSLALEGVTGRLVGNRVGVVVELWAVVDTILPVDNNVVLSLNTAGTHWWWWWDALSGADKGVGGGARSELVDSGQVDSVVGSGHQVVQGLLSSEEVATSRDLQSLSIVSVDIVDGLVNQGVTSDSGTTIGIAILPVNINGGRGRKATSTNWGSGWDTLGSAHELVGCGAVSEVVGGCDGDSVVSSCSKALDGVLSAEEGVGVHRGEDGLRLSGVSISNWLVGDGVRKDWDAAIVGSIGPADNQRVSA